jgi:hypothetical protein
MTAPSTHDAMAVARSRRGRARIRRRRLGEAPGRPAPVQTEAVRDGAGSAMAAPCSTMPRRHAVLHLAIAGRRAVAMGRGRPGKEREGGKIYISVGPHNQ